jgi:hypothetical protein
MEGGVKPITAIPKIDTILHYFVNWNHGEATTHHRDTPAFGTFMGKDNKKDSKDDDGEAKKLTQEQGDDKARRVNCICGDTHLFSACPYVNENKKPKNFKKDPEIRKKFDNIAKQDTTFARILRKAIKKAKEGENKKEKSDTKKNKSSREDSASNFLYDQDEYAFSIAAPPIDLIMTIGDIKLKNSTLLDRGTRRHIFNDAKRFITMEPLPEPRRGDSESWIEKKRTVI